MEERKYRNIIIISLIVILGILAYLLIKPLFVAILWGFVLAYIFYPLYKLILKAVKLRDIAAAITCILLILLVGIPFWFLTPRLFNEVFNIYLYVQDIDIVNFFKTNLPNFFASDEFAKNAAFALDAFITKSLNSVLNYISDFIIRIPYMLLEIAVAVVTFYFAIRDAHLIKEYMKSISPFNVELEKRFMQNSLDVTNSVIFGQVIIGFVQGVLAGISFYIFGVPDALVLTILAIILGVMPIVGPTAIQVPIIIYFFISGNTFSAIGMLIYYAITNGLEVVIRTMYIAKKTKLSTYLAFVGTLGGVFVFGALGLIIGPLIIAYLIILLELYRNKKFSSIFSLDLEKKEMP